VRMSVLRCVAVCVAVRCSVLQCVAVCFSVCAGCVYGGGGPKGVAVFSVLQYVLQCVLQCMLQCVLQYLVCCRVCCNVQCAAVESVLQCVIVLYSVLHCAKRSRDHWCTCVCCSVALYVAGCSMLQRLLQSEV